MKLSNLRSLALVATIAACDSGQPAGADAKASADVKAGAEVKAAADVKAGADAKAVADAAAKAGAGATVSGGVAVAGDVVVPPLKPVVEVEAALGKKIALKAADLDLGALARLVIDGKVVGGAQLELLLNAPGGASHHVDVDADGTLDYVQVVEIRAAGSSTLELRAIPSSKLDASLAVLVGSIMSARLHAESKLQISASYAAAVEGGADFRLDERFDVQFQTDGTVKFKGDRPGPMVAWFAVQTVEPAYVSTHVAAADIQVGADGALQFANDASVRLTAEQLIDLRGALKVDVGAGVNAGVNAGAKVEADAKAAIDAAAKQAAKAAAKAEASVKHGAKAGAGIKVGGGGGGGVGVGVKVGGGVSVGGGGGVSVGGGGGGSAKGGIKIGK